MFDKSIRNYTVAGTMALGVVLAGTVANAAVIDASVGGVPDALGVVYENFNGLPAGAGGGVTGSGITVSFAGTGGGAVTGSASGQYAAPFLSAGNGALFGDADGPTTSQYLSTGIGSAELELGNDFQYFGVLWGSVDDFNLLEFYDDADLLFSFSGLDVDGLADGDQGASGTYYVNINSDTAFNRVVASSTDYAFEFDNVALGIDPIGPGPSEVSEPAALAVMGLGLLGMGFVARRRRKA